MENMVPLVDQMHGDSGASEIDLIELLLALWRRAAFILLISLLGAIIVGAYTFRFITPLYKATSQIYVTNTTENAVNLSDIQIGNYLTSDYLEVIKTFEVYEQVKQNLSLNYTYDQMASMLRVENPTSTRILKINVFSPSAVEATNMANEYAKVVQKYASDKMRTDAPSILSVAQQPVRPNSPSLSRNTILGFLLGFFISAMIVIILFLLDDKVKSEDDIAKYTGMATLAMIPLQKKGAMKKVTKDSEQGRAY